MKKSGVSVGIIGGADGPTAIIVGGRRALMRRLAVFAAASAAVAAALLCFAAGRGKNWGGVDPSQPRK